MSVNSERSMNADLHEGMTDGSYRKRYPNWGGSPMPGNVKITDAQRSSAWDVYMNDPEAKAKVAGDGTPC